MRTTKINKQEKPPTKLQMIIWSIIAVVLIFGVYKIDKALGKTPHKLNFCIARSAC